jgi:hypothetical protein
MAWFVGSLPAGARAILIASIITALIHQPGQFFNYP